MSRVGLMPIPVPKGTKVQVAEGVFRAEGPKGKVEQTLFEGYPVAVEEGEIKIARGGDSGPERAKHGLMRALLANNVHGVTEGFKRLDIVGVGYRAEVKGRERAFPLGYSHPVIFPIPDGIEIEPTSAPTGSR